MSTIGAQVARFGSLFSLLLLGALGGGCGDGDSGSAGAKLAVRAQLAQLSRELLPPPLKSQQQGRLSRKGGDPCGVIPESDRMLQFLKCQPILLRRYLLMADFFLAELSSWAGELEEDLVEAGSAGPAQIALGEGETLFVQKQSNAAFELLVRTAYGTALHGEVSGASVSFLLDGQEVGDSSAGRAPGIYQVTASLADGDNWQADIFIAGLGCDAFDTNAPERLRLIMGKAGGIWHGTVMTYHPLSGQPCTTQASDASAMNIYTSLVADHGAAKAWVYMLSRTVATTDTLESYAIGKVCENFPHYCFESTSSYVAQVALPFCAVTGEALPRWGDDCGSVSPGVAEQASDSALHWIAPQKLYTDAIPELPGAL